MIHRNVELCWRYHNKCRQNRWHDGLKFNPTPPSNIYIYIYTYIVCITHNWNKSMHTRDSFVSILLQRYTMKYQSVSWNVAFWHVLSDLLILTIYFTALLLPPDQPGLRKTRNAARILVFQIQLRVYDTYYIAQPFKWYRWCYLYTQDPLTIISLRPSDAYMRR